MKANFIIKFFSDIMWNDKYIDLHNCFDFIGLINNNDGNIILQFQKYSAAAWVKKDELNKLTFIHKQVSFYYDKEGESALENDKGILAEVTFFPSDERETNDAFIDQEIPNNNDDIIYTFEDGRIIRIGCEEIELIAS